MAKLTKEQAEQHVRELLEYVGEDPNRAGLQGTPERVVRMWKELFRGYDPAQKPKITVFDNGKDNLVCDQMVTDTGDFASMCEHHVLPFMGQYFFAYIPHPNGKILGLSKIARVVDYCAARMQIQERLVHDVVNMIEEALTSDVPAECAPLGIACVMKAHHTCKEIRGARKKGIMSNSCLKGLFLTDAAVRSEFMNLVNNTKIE
jgi:GTP cyclohydrolase I